MRVWALTLAAGLVPVVAGIFVHARAAPAAAVLEPGEELPGGAATTLQSFDNADAFSHFSHGIGLEGESKFKIGNAIFRRLWVSAPSSTRAADGLGPLYNARGCQNCHLKDGRGRPPNPDMADPAISMLVRLSIPPPDDNAKRLLAEGRVNAIGDPVYGGQLQTVAVPGLSAEGRISVSYTGVPVTLGDGTTITLRSPTYSVHDLGYGPLAPDVMLSPRVAQPMIGLGLIEAIPEADIRARADPDDRDGDGISGRPNEVWSIDENRLALGRFGWKAGVPSIRQQAAEAAVADMGLSNPMLRLAYGDCTSRQPACLAMPNGNTEGEDGVEIAPELFDLLVFYSENLAVPRRRGADEPTVLAGKQLFHASGCAGCHTPSFKTGAVAGQPHLSAQTIWPYTDLLLHDMGDGLADNRPEGLASGREWRTAPLWGVGLTQTVSGHTLFLHDGRARSVEEAILWHDGEAKRARDAYAALSKEEREALLAFVNSL